VTNLAWRRFAKSIARQIKKRLRFAKFVPEINVDRVGAADTMRALVF